MWCWCLVLCAVSAVANGQIVFGGSSSGTNTNSGSALSPTRRPFTPARRPSSPARRPFIPPPPSPSIPVREIPSPGRGAGGTSTGTGRSCTSPEGVRGVCGPADGCATVLRKIRERDADYLRRAYCGRERRQIQLCCADSSRADSSPPSSPGSFIFASRPSQSRPPSFSAPQSPRPTARPTSRPTARPTSRPTVRPTARPRPPPFFSSPSCPKFRSPSSCGSSPFSPSRVVNGVPVQSLGDFPWMAALKYSSEPRFKCGGAIIHERWILTAAHCLLSDGPTDVVISDLNLATDTDDSIVSPPQTVPVQLTARHPGYRRVVSGNDKGVSNDVALIKLARPIRFTDSVKPICLDSRTMSVSEMEGDEAFVAGWGATEFGGLTSPSMQWGRVRISNFESCRNLYARRGTRVDTSQLCAIGENERGGVDTCHGDSGGPLMKRRLHNNVQRWFVAGIVSFGTGCGNPDNPGVYSYVGTHLDWISCTINSN